MKTLIRVLVTLLLALSANAQTVAHDYAVLDLGNAPAHLVDPGSKAIKDEIHAAYSDFLQRIAKARGLFRRPDQPWRLYKPDLVTVEYEMKPDFKYPMIAFKTLLERAEIEADQFLDTSVLQPDNIYLENISDSVLNTWRENDIPATRPKDGLPFVFWDKAWFGRNQSDKVVSCLNIQTPGTYRPANLPHWTKASLIEATGLGIVIRESDGTPSISEWFLEPWTKGLDGTASLGGYPDIHKLFEIRAKLLPLLRFSILKFDHSVYGSMLHQQESILYRFNRAWQHISFDATSDEEYAEPIYEERASYSTLTADGELAYVWPEPDVPPPPPPEEDDYVPPPVFYVPPGSIPAVVPFGDVRFSSMKKTTYFTTDGWTGGFGPACYLGGHAGFSKFDLNARYQEWTDYFYDVVIHANESSSAWAYLDAGKTVVKFASESEEHFPALSIFMEIRIDEMDYEGPVGEEQLTGVITHSEELNDVEGTISRVWPEKSEVPSLSNFLSKFEIGRLYRVDKTAGVYDLSLPVKEQDFLDNLKNYKRPDVGADVTLDLFGEHPNYTVNSKVSSWLKAKLKSNLCFILQTIDTTGPAPATLPAAYSFARKDSNGFPLLADTNRDDVWDGGAGYGGPALLGLVAWQDEFPEPQVMLPLELRNAPSSSNAAVLHLVDKDYRPWIWDSPSLGKLGGSSWYRTNSVWFANSDTRVIASCFDFQSEPYRKVAFVQRPRGQVVSFGFEYDSDCQKFSKVGYPLAPFENQTYVLYDLTPVELNLGLYDLNTAQGRQAVENYLQFYHRRGSYSLNFDSGIAHLFDWNSGNLDEITFGGSHIAHNGTLSETLDLALNTIAYRDHGLGQNVLLTKIGTTLSQFSRPAVHPDDLPSAATISWKYPPGEWPRVAGMAKSGIFDPFDVLLDSDSLEFPALSFSHWRSIGLLKHEDRVKSGNQPAIQTEKSFNKHHQVQEVKTYSTAGVGNRIQSFTYSGLDGRIPATGRPRSSVVEWARDSHSAQSVKYEYEPSTGWLKKVDFVPDGSLSPAFKNFTSRVFGYSDLAAPQDESSHLYPMASMPVSVQSFLDGVAISQASLEFSGPWSYLSRMSARNTPAVSVPGAPYTSVTNGENYQSLYYQNGPFSSFESFVDCFDNEDGVFGRFEGEMLVVTRNRSPENIVSEFYSDVLGNFRRSRTLLPDLSVASDIKAVAFDDYGRPARIDRLVPSPTRSTFLSDYDIWGPRRVVEPDGATVIERSPDGLVTKIDTTEVDGYMQEYVYDEFGRVVSSSRTFKSETLRESFAYDSGSRLVSHTGPDQKTTTWLWNQIGSTCTQRNPDNTFIRTRYHSDGSPGQAWGTAQEGFYTSWTTKPSLDEAKQGLWQFVRNGLRAPVKTFVDAQGLVGEISGPLVGNPKEMTYDGFKPTGMTQHGGRELSFLHDAQNRVNGVQQRGPGGVAVPGLPSFQVNQSYGGQAASQSFVANGQTLTTSTTRFDELKGSSTSRRSSGQSTELESDWEYLEATAATKAEYSIDGLPWGRSVKTIFEKGQVETTKVLDGANNIIGKLTWSGYNVWGLPGRLVRGFGGDAGAGGKPDDTYDFKYDQSGQLEEVKLNGEVIASYGRKPGSRKIILHKTPDQEVLLSDGPAPPPSQAALPGAPPPAQFDPEAVAPPEEDAGFATASAKGVFGSGVTPHRTLSEDGALVELKTTKDGRPVTVRWVRDPDTGRVVRKEVVFTPADAQAETVVPLEVHAYDDNGRTTFVEQVGDGLAPSVTTAYAYDPVRPDAVASITSYEGGVVSASAQAQAQSAGVGQIQQENWDVNGQPGRITQYMQGILPPLAAPDLARSFELTRQYDSVAGTALNESVRLLDAQPEGGVLQFSAVWQPTANALGLASVQVSTSSGSAPSGNDVSIIYSHSMPGQANVEDSRLRTLTQGDVQVQYDYFNPGYDRVKSATVLYQGQPVLRREFTLDWANQDRLSAIDHHLLAASGTPTLASSYGYAGQGSRIQSITQADGTTWTYQYDSPRQQLIGATLAYPDGSPVPGMTFQYAYDDAGNPLYTSSAGIQVWFESDELNQVSALVRRNAFGIMGRVAEPSGVVKLIVNGVDAQVGADGRFFCETPLPPQFSGGPFRVVALLHHAGVDGSGPRVAKVVGRVELPPALADVVHGRGNRQSDGQRHYEWDAFDRLISVTSGTFGQRVNVRYAYLPDGRRVSKQVSRETGNANWTIERTVTWAYDGWNPVLETETPANGGPTITREYVWGLDLAGLGSGQTGDRQEAGGIGGLVAVKSGGQTWIPVMDQVGTVQKLINAATGAVDAEFFLGPYGEPLGETGNPAAIAGCPFRFNTKMLDQEVGLYYYGYRFYSPAELKWINRDPLKEAGGINTLCFAGNNPVSRVDALGLFEDEHNFAESPRTGVWYNKSFDKFSEVPAIAAGMLGPPITYADFMFYHARNIGMRPLVWLGGDPVSDIRSGCIDLRPEADQVTRGDVYILAVNGILNEFEKHFLDDIAALSVGRPIREFADKDTPSQKIIDGLPAAEKARSLPIDYVYNPTYGWQHDIPQCGLELGGFGMIDNVSIKIKERIEWAIKTKRFKAVILIAHSQGGLKASNAFAGLSPVLRGKVHVVTYGGAQFKPFLGAAAHYDFVKNGDMVPQILGQGAVLRPLLAPVFGTLTSTKTSFQLIPKGKNAPGQAYFGLISNEHSFDVWNNYARPHGYSAVVPVFVHHLYGTINQGFQP